MACNFDAVVLVNQPGVSICSLFQYLFVIYLPHSLQLHATDLRILPASSALPKMLEAAPSAAQLSHVQLPGEHSRHRVANDLSHRCGSRMLSLSEAKSLHQEEISGNTFVVDVEVPAVEMAGGRKSQMAAIGMWSYSCQLCVGLILRILHSGTARQRT